jgi:magnesium-transporting ATPase (P-type)
VTCDTPNDKIYNFKGTSDIVNNRIINLDNSNVLLRGMKLSYGSKILGYVVYTGFETKIVKNEG